MSDYTKESISNLLFEKVDAILIVDALNDSYHSIKKSGIFQDILENDGNYKKLVEKLWFHFNDKSDKITDDYHVFIPMIGKFKGKYVDRIKLHFEDKSYLIQISIYPLDLESGKYLFMLDIQIKSLVD